MNNNNPNEPRENWNDQQQALADELVAKYEIEYKDILFFGDDPEPFLTYEANSMLCNHLANISAIDVEPVPAVSEDSVSVRCTLTIHNGYVRSAVGVTNVNEKINGAEPSSQQIYNLAASRAMRSALRSAGIKLINRHREAMGKTDELSLKIQSNSDSLLRQAHALGAEKGLIIGANKTLWYHELWTRYRVNSSKNLTEEQLADFVAYLNSYVPPTETETALAA